MSIQFDLKTRSHIYRFTDTELSINFKPYAYKDLTLLGFHRGNRFINSYYELQHSSGKKLVIGFKFDEETYAKLNEIMEYISSFDSEATKEYLSRNASFEFIVSDIAPAENYFSADECNENLKKVVNEYLKDKNFYLSDYVFEGDIVLVEGEDSQFLEIYIHDPYNEPVLIGFVPDDVFPKMTDFVFDGASYELRLIVMGYGIKNKKYMANALLKFSK